MKICAAVTAAGEADGYTCGITSNRLPTMSVDLFDIVMVNSGKEETCQGLPGCCE
jgi:hypothetical protein